MGLRGQWASLQVSHFSEAALLTYGLKSSSLLETVERIRKAALLIFESMPLQKPRRELSEIGPYL